MQQVNIGFILLNIGYAIHHGDWNYQRISSPFARIYLVKEGTAKLHLPDKVQILLPNHLYIIPPFTSHSYECNGHFLYYIHIYEPQQVVKRILEDFIYPTEIDASASDAYLVERLMEILLSSPTSKPLRSTLSSAVTLKPDSLITSAAEVAFVYIVNFVSPS